LVAGLFQGLPCYSLPESYYGIRYLYRDFAVYGLKVYDAFLEVDLSASVQYYVTCALYIHIYRRIRSVQFFKPLQQLSVAFDIGSRHADLEDRFGL